MTAARGTFALTGSAANLTRVVPGTRLGVPSVPTGLETDIALPSLPGSWTANVANYYYVRSGGSNSGNGYPASPRGTLPSPIPAGAVVVLDNTATLTVSNYNLQMSGTSGSRCWLIGSARYGLGSGSAVSIISQGTSAGITATYAYIDGIDFLTTGTSSDLWGWNNPKNVLMRGCTFRGSGAARANNNAHGIGGNSTSDRATNVVFYQCTVRDTGLWTYNSGNDTDVHGVQLGNWIDGLWILDSSFYHCQGDGIQATANGGATSNIRNIWINGCTFYENLQTGLWFKMGSNIVVSQNTFYNFTNGGGSAPIATGGQYDLGGESGLWWIANRIYDCSNGIRIASSSNGVANQKLRFIGNVISNCNAVGGTVQTGSPYSDGCPFSFWQGGDVYVGFNTMWGYAGHGIGTTPGSANGIKIENNIFQNRTNGSCTEIMLESYTTAPKIRNNQFPTSARFAMNTTAANYTSVSALQSADSTNRTNNRSSATSFVNAANGPSGDFRLNAGDGAINAGLVTTDIFAEFQTAFGIDIRKDFAGVTRPVGGTYDIGAYEQ